MKLRDYINNNEIVNESNVKQDLYIVAKDIIESIKYKNYDEAANLLNQNLNVLYINLDIDSFCFLIDYYINNTDNKYHYVLNNNAIPSIITELSNDYNQKNKAYFINKTKAFYDKKRWRDCLRCIEILIEKTDVDTIEINKNKVPLLINLKEYKILEKHLKQYINILDKDSLTRGYLALSRYYEHIKKYNEAYLYHNKIKELDVEYKIPNYIIKKINRKNRKEAIKKFVYLRIKKNI
ncbi:MAG: hypothetical protein ACRDA3_04475 [Peptostreptococcaceae bacterium]